MEVAFDRVRSKCFVKVTPIHLKRLPERIGVALADRAMENEYPIAAIVEMAIASFLDSEALGFADCKPGRGQ